MLALGILLAVSAAVNAVALVALWRRRSVPPADFIVAHEATDGPRRFRIIFWTDKGAAARTLWEKVTPVADGLVEFFDGTDCRGRKEPK